jgi:hypothetical protein
VVGGHVLGLVDPHDARAFPVGSTVPCSRRLVTAASQSRA